MTDYLECIGDTVGDYRLVRWLGGGGFGNVYLAEHVRESSLVAIKMLRIRLTRPDDLRTFINEARTIRLKHPHIMPLLDFGLSRDDTPFLVMEYAPMGTMRHRYPKGSCMPLYTAVAYVNQVASALQYAHQAHLVHRDVKPENMLLRSDDVLLLSDFGIATSAHSTYSLSANQGVGGTVLYMAPEQLQGKPRKESDQYALAVVVYEWLTGRCPFVGTAMEIAIQHVTMLPPSLVEQISEVPCGVEEVLCKAMSKDPKGRFASMQEFAIALQRASMLTKINEPFLQESFTTLPQPEINEPFLQESFTTLPQPGVDETPLQESSTIMSRFEIDEMPLRESSTIKPSALTDLSEFPPSQAVELPPVRPHRLSKGYVALLSVLILLLIGGGSYAYPVARSMIISMQVTGPAATATAITIAGSTARAAYQTRVARDGIMLGFDAQHTHNNPYEVILNTANVSRLQQKWIALTGDLIATSPVVANGLVYIGSRDHKLYAFDAITGQQKWTAPTGAAIDSSPAVANGLVYVGSWDHQLYAFDATTGQQKWAASTGNAVVSSPTVANGLVYVGSVDHKLYAFDATTGRQKWTSLTGGIITTSPAVANGLVYIGSKDGKLYAFDATTGQQKWVSPADQFSYSSPAIANGLVYIGSEDHQLYAFDATTGQQKWVSFPTGANIRSSPAVANGLVYVGSWDRQLYAFDATTGRQKWAALTAGAITSSPTVANGVIYIGSEGHQLYAFDATTGQQKWAAPTGNTIFFSTPTVANGMVYTGCIDGQLYAFSL